MAHIVTSPHTNTKLNSLHTMPNNEAQIVVRWVDNRARLLIPPCTA